MAKGNITVSGKPATTGKKTTKDQIVEARKELQNLNNEVFSNPNISDERRAEIRKERDVLEKKIVDLMGKSIEESVSTKKRVEEHTPALAVTSGKNVMGEKEFSISTGDNTLVKVSTKKEADDFIAASKNRDTAQAYINNISMRWIRADQAKNSSLKYKLKNMKEAMEKILKNMGQ